MRELALSALIGVLVVAGAMTPSASALAETLMLKDGTVVHGEIQALQDDVYTVKTDTLGTVRVHKRDVRSIDYSGSDSGIGSSAASSSNGSEPGLAELEAMQLRMMQDPNLLALIQALQSDPDVLSVLSDPEIMSAIAAGDYAALMNHPKIVALTRNPNMRALIDEAR